MDKEKVKPMLAGHRERVRDILYACTTVGKNIPERMILEYLLFTIYRRKDTSDLSRLILMKFGSLSNVFKATKEELMSIEEVSEKVANLIIAYAKLLNDISFDTNNNAKLSRFSQVYQVFNSELKDNLGYTVVFLDAGRHYLTHTYLLGFKDLNEVGKCTIRDGLICNAAAVIFYNYDKNSSEKDFVTADIIEAFNKLYVYLRLAEIQVFDYLGITDSIVLSYQMCGLVEQAESYYKKYEESLYEKKYYDKFILEDSGLMIKYEDADIFFDKNGVAERKNIEEILPEVFVKFSEDTEQ